jgi:hypothetical protein
MYSKLLCKREDGNGTSHHLRGISLIYFLQQVSTLVLWFMDNQIPCFITTTLKVIIQETDTHALIQVPRDASTSSSCSFQ